MKTILGTIAAVLSAAVLGGGAQAGARAAGEQLVFANGGDLYLRSTAGAVRRLTRSSAFDGFPAWSRDGRWIVFTRAPSADSPDSDIYVMRANGSGARRLAGSARGAQDLYPRFSPNGKLIVFTSNRDGRERDVYLMRADGTNVRRLTLGPKSADDTQPDFSRDGSHVVFTSNRLAYFNYEVFRIGVGGGGLTRLTFWGSGEDGAPGDDISPSYSPDGKRIAFVSDRGGGYAIWTMSANGRNLREVTRHKGYNVVFPRFSPDGGSLVYTALPNAAGLPKGDRLWTVRLDGSGRTQLGRGSAADW